MHNSTQIKANNFKSKVIYFDKISKKYGNFFANHNLSFGIEKGTIHGIVGENGAGKSTAMNILYGTERPTSGEIFLNQNPVNFKSPKDAMKAGIGMVHQHFLLAAPHTVLDNIILGFEPKQKFFSLAIDRARAKARIHRLMGSYGLEVDLGKKICDLPVGAQQRVEILKVLYRKSKIIILDEPTAVLTPKEVDSFFEQLTLLKQEGITVILITHKLKEILKITDHVSVIRQGKLIKDAETSSFTEKTLSAAMIQAKDNPNTPSEPKQPQYGLVNSNQKLNVQNTLKQPNPLKIKNLTFFSKASSEIVPKNPSKAKPDLTHIHMDVKPNEIVGIAGVSGNGQEALVEAILHPKHLRQNYNENLKGSIKVNGISTYNLNERQLRKLGVGAMLPDRLNQSLIGKASMLFNFRLGRHKKNWIHWKTERLRLKKLLLEYDVHPKNPDAIASALSGGNQQKFVVGRELLSRPNFVLACEPTRGVDISSVTHIHKMLTKSTESGSGILLISSDLDEVLSLSDRVYVIYEGWLKEEFHPKVDRKTAQAGLFDKGSIHWNIADKRGWDIEKIGLSMGGGSQ